MAREVAVRHAMLGLVLGTAAGLAHAGAIGQSPFGVFSVHRGGAYAGAPAAVVYADLDGDGWEDAAILGHTPDTDLNEAFGIDIYRGGPDGPGLVGTIELLKELDFFAWPAEPGLVSGDFDGDGVTDLLGVLGGDPGVLPEQGVYLLRGVGDLTFEVDGVLGSPDSIVGAVMGDLDRDGRDEAVLWRAGTDGFVGVYRWSASTGFESVWSRTLGERVTTVALAPIDADGELDLVVGTGSGTAAYAGLGGGAFGLTPIATTTQVASLFHTADMDLDGKSELLFSRGYGELGLMRDGGLGQLEVVVFADHTTRVAGSIDAGDVDGNGVPDLIVGLFVPNVGRRDVKVFTNPLSAIADDVQEIWPPCSGGWPHAVDLDHDGRLDLLCVRYGPVFIPPMPDLHGWGIVRNRGGGERSLVFGPHAVNLAGNLLNVTLRDFDGDGVDEALVCGSSSVSPDIRVLATSDEGVLARTDFEYQADGRAFLAVPLDFDRDGDSDFATVLNEGQVLVFRNEHPLGSFADPIVIPLSGGMSYGLARADFDGDGYPGLAATSEVSQELIVITNTGGVFGEPVGYSAGEHPFTVAAGDFDGDGFGDAVVLDRHDERLRVYLSGGDTVLAQSETIVLEDDPYWIRAKDVNGDGHGDLVVTREWGESLSVFLGDGAGGFSGAVESACGRFGIEADLADMNGDGTLDAAVTTLFQDGAGGLPLDLDTRVLLGQGDGSFEPWVRLPSCGSGSAAIGDVTGDGLPDIVSVNSEMTRELFVFDQLPPPPACAADLDANGVLNFDDLDAFIAAYLAGGPAADLDGSGVVNFDDLDLFIASYLGGCP